MGSWNSYEFGHNTSLCCLATFFWIFVGCSRNDRYHFFDQTDRHQEKWWKELTVTMEDLRMMRWS